MLRGRCARAGGCNTDARVRDDPSVDKLTKPPLTVPNPLKTTSPENVVDFDTYCCRKLCSMNTPTDLQS